MDAYIRYEKYRSQPSLNDLEDMFQAIAPLYKDGVYVIVDALDECQVSNSIRSKFIKTLLRLQSREINLNILATSRSLPDIEQAFYGHSRLKIIAQREDIERYLRNRMSDLCSAAKRSELQNEVIIRIADAADGMYVTLP
ncbi:uncharacterized protein CTHT_0018020 [Thermochaetoides thermophila DSM 1495]|uniref:Nephrocystin 3-like N-terminal domain-containing protein n=1 Tax=Chaetomium thermophilum (strain DSM 1495 / CBS 144.50 / IMI 039719) TaxID=759272 RepID=G0S2P8_CHATD|nr:hypothetical protein CTHT_0018020 [Thermochaetoides thermophila DSM 1495]EGS22281.1 hypothetical protein CTHT_0018020 [Thermochaetoides thermophila DSM 1495]